MVQQLQTAHYLRSDREWEAIMLTGRNREVDLRQKSVEQIFSDQFVQTSNQALMDSVHAYRYFTRWTIFAESAPKQRDNPIW